MTQANSLILNNNLIVKNKTNPFWQKLGQDIDGEAAEDESGYDISLSQDGTILAIGATNNDGNGDSSGHVRVYQWNGTDTWT